MVTYEVTSHVEPARVPEYERFMREHHIPALLATKCFDEAEFLTAGPGRYQIRYRAPSQAELERYFADHAPRLRAHFLAHFPDGVQLARETWVAIQDWVVGREAPA